MSTWFRPGAARAGADRRLFLFHPAGGGASLYGDWLRLLPADVAGQCVQLPGRQDRRAEAAYTRFEPLLADLTEAVDAELDGRPFGFFGHSMGALLAYRVAVELERAGRPAPALLAVSGWAPRGVTSPLPDAATLTEAEVVERMLALGSIPPSAAAAPELLALAAPAMRADIIACTGYEDDGARVASPIVAYSGAADPLLPPSAMASWAARSPVYLGNRTFPGHHFFLLDEALPITMELTDLLRRTTAPAGR